MDIIEIKFVGEGLESNKEYVIEYWRKVCLLYSGRKFKRIVFIVMWKVEL